MIILGIISIILMIILLIPFHISLKLERKKDHDNIQIKFIFVKGYINFKIDIPFIDITEKNNNFFIKIFSKKKNKKKEKIISVENIIEKAYEYKKYSYILIKVHNYFTQRIKIKRIIWKTKLGLEDAAITGMLTGTLWSIKSNILFFITNNYKTKEVKLDVTPFFNENVFEIYFNCIIRFKMVYIIVAGLKGLIAKIERR
ncbi:MAG: DUF2953 domain-containing protein [Firmicutes bacterium]|nr:DUF2953 domain-containing protein [Bacillota bacterium]